MEVEPSSSPVTARSETVLIVDDMPENLRFLGEILQAEGYRVKAATSGAAALRYAAAEPQPSVILLDVMMPVMDGYEVLAALRQSPVTQDIPVLFLTALGDPADEERGLTLGAQDYLTKPVKPPVVLARLRTQLQAKAARDGLRSQNLWLEAEVARRMQENDLIQQASIRALAHLAETRDPETGNHILRTQAYVRVLAEHLSLQPAYAAVLTPHAINMLARSAPLHDIGKVGIPDHILLKPGKLTPSEWEVMKTHAKIGAEAIEQAERDLEQPLEFLLVAKQIAGAHHERWDGTGYPAGLAGEAIPLSARLMSVADVFDALISARVYKAPMSFEEAHGLILQGRGTQFDPAVVDAFEQTFDRFVNIALKHHDEGMARASAGA